MVLQLGLAMILCCAVNVFPLTSGTMSGISGSMRQAEELSMTVHPAAANFGAQALDVVPPAENKATWGARATACSRVTTVYGFPRNTMVFPADFSDATGINSVTGNCRSSRICNILLPTNPVAPTTPTFML
jgi:hypothetical protein